MATVVEVKNLVRNKTERYYLSRTLDRFGLGSDFLRVNDGSSTLEITDLGKDSPSPDKRVLVVRDTSVGSASLRRGVRVPLEGVRSHSISMPLGTGGNTKVTIVDANS